jgi:hypothetical protein
MVNLSDEDFLLKLALMEGRDSIEVFFSRHHKMAKANDAKALGFNLS